ncbi:MAG: portal protein, partial [Candidatus Methylomirabilis sp.]
MMPTETGLIARAQVLREQRRQFETVWQNIADHGLGRRDFLTMRTPGTDRMARIYDNTFLLGAQMLAAGVQSLIANTATQWFELVPEESWLLDDQDVAAWIDGVEARLLALFNRPTTGFITQTSEVCFDLVSFGTGAFYVGEDDSGPWFSSRPLGELVVAEDSRGRIDTVFRDFTMPAREVVDKFP